MLHRIRHSTLIAVCDHGSVCLLEESVSDPWRPIMAKLQIACACAGRRGLRSISLAIQWSPPLPESNDGSGPLTMLSFNGRINIAKPTCSLLVIFIVGMQCKHDGSRSTGAEQSILRLWRVGRSPRVAQNAIVHCQPAINVYYQHEDWSLAS